MKRIAIIFALALSASAASGQALLTLDDAVARALEFNFGLQVAAVNAQIADNTANPGQAGLLPTVTLSAGANYSRNNATATLINPDQSPGAPSSIEREINGIQTYGANTSLGVSYTVFDGLGSVNNYRLLQSNANLSSNQVRILVQTTLAQVMNVYYQIGRQQKALKIREEALARSRARLAFVQNQNAFAAVNRLAVLNAEVDLNTDSVNLAAAQLAFGNTRRDLNYLLGQPTETEFTVAEELAFVQMGTLDDLTSAVLTENPELEASRLNQDIAELNLKIARAGRMPRLAVNASYGFNYANNGPISFAQEITSNGLTGGATLSVPIFNGFRGQTAVENAEFGVQNARNQRLDRELALQRDVAKAYAVYQNNLSLIRLNQRSLEAAQLNFDRTREAFELGQATSVQFREAQLNLLTVENRLNDLRFDVKLQEVELMRISGRLLDTQD